MHNMGPFETNPLADERKHAQRVNTDVVNLLFTCHTRTHTDRHTLVGSPVFGDVCSAVLKIAGSSQGCGPERGDTRSRRRACWGRGEEGQGTANASDHSPTTRLCRLNMDSNDSHGAPCQYLEIRPRVQYSQPHL